MAQRSPVRRLGPLVWMERFCTDHRTRRCHLFLALPSPIDGRGLRHPACDSPCTHGDACLLDALAGATSYLHPPANPHICLAITLVPTRARVHATIIPAPAASHGVVDELTRWVHDRVGTDWNVRPGQRHHRLL